MDGTTSRGICGRSSLLPTHSLSPWGHATSSRPPPHHLPLTSLSSDGLLSLGGKPGARELKSAKLSHSASQEGSLRFEAWLFRLQPKTKILSLVQPLEGGFSTGLLGGRWIQ